MKKYFVGVALAVVLMMSGCSLIEKQATKEFYIDFYDIRFVAPSEWEQVEDTPYNIQLFNGHSYFGVMAHKNIDLAEGVTPLDIYELYQSDLISKRDHVKIVEEDTVYESEGKSVSYRMYSAERDGSKNYYCSCLVIFEEEETFAWIIITAIPSYMLENKDEMLKIVDSMECIE